MTHLGQLGVLEKNNFYFQKTFHSVICWTLDLGITTDHVIEHMHSYVNKMLTKSMYKLKNVQSKIGSKRQHRGIVKINSFAVKIQLK